MWCINLGSNQHSYTGSGSTAQEQLLACFDRHVDAVIDTRGESDILIEGKNGAFIPNFPDETGVYEPRRKELVAPQRQLPYREIPVKMPGIPLRKTIYIPDDDDYKYYRMDY